MRRTIECGSVLVGLVAALVASSMICAQTINIDATDHGWYNSAGQHYPNNVNYLVGDTLSSGRDFRNFFVFDMSRITRTITSAKLALTLPSGSGYNSADPSENYELHDVTTPISTLVNGATVANSAAGLATYADLGTGTVYGSRTITPADGGTVVEIALNSSAVSALDAAPGLIALGGLLTTLDAAANNESIFFNTHLVQTVTQLRLTLSHVPPGNFNDDKAVDAADYVAWRKSDATQAGYGGWRANFGAAISSGTSSVPEPSAIWLLAAISLFGYGKRIARNLGGMP